MILNSQNKYFFQKRQLFSGNSNKNSIFIVVGRLGRNLVVSKILPIIASGLFTHIYVFSEESGIPMNNTSYIILPNFIKTIRLVLLRKIIRIFYEPLQLIYYSFKYHPKIIHGFYTIPKGLNSLIASNISGSRCIISIIGGKEEIETSFFIKKLSRPLIIWLLKKADFITTKGIKDNKYLIQHGIREEKICVYNGAIDLNRFCYKGEKKDIDLLFAGYFDKSKGPQRALDIINKVINKLPNINAFFIGNGPLFQSILDETSKLGLSSNVSFAGYVNDSENYFKRSNVLVFPSSNEGLSTAMLEAMSCRCVPITSDVGNQTEAALHEYNSIVISDYNDIQSFTEYTIKLLKERNHLFRLAQNAENTIKGKYSPKSQGQICKQFYLKLM